MTKIPKNITIGEMWDSGIPAWRFWLIAPFIPVLMVLGSLLVSLETNNSLWFVFGFPLAIVFAIGFKIWDKKVSD